MVLAELEPSVAAAVSASFLRDLPDGLMRELLLGSTLRDVRAGHVFLTAGRAPRCGILVEGLARTFTVGPNGAQTTLNRIGRGAAIGIRAVIARNFHSNAQAITDCGFLQLDEGRLLRVGPRHAEVAWAIARELDRRLEATFLQLESQHLGSIRQRLAGMLLDISVDGKPLIAETTQERIAELVAASREAVGRALRKMQSDGLVRLARGCVIVTDPLRLELAATGDPPPRSVRLASQSNETHLSLL